MKTNKKFWHCFIILLMGMLYTGSLQAQVMIGSETTPKGFSLLEISVENKKGGLRLPQLDEIRRDSLTLAQTLGDLSDSMRGLVIYNTTQKCFEFWDGTQWVNLCDGSGGGGIAEPKWFYMPSIVIDVSESKVYTRNLYLEYRKQFDDAMDSTIESPDSSPKAGTALVGNPSAPKSGPVFNTFTTIYAANELNYYVTGYDATVFSAISITDTGILTYTVDASKVSDATFMNIVFVVK